MNFDSGTSFVVTRANTYKKKKKEKITGYFLLYQLYGYKLVHHLDTIVVVYSPFSFNI